MSGDTSGPVGPINVHLYHDVDKADRIMPFSFGSDTTAEKLILYIVNELRITPCFFFIFAIAKKDLSLWYAPNEREAFRNGGDFVFRIRFIPTDEYIQNLSVINEATQDYLFLQLRDDFINCRATYRRGEDGNQVNQAYILGLSVIDILRWGKQNNFNLKTTKKQMPKIKKFIPVALNECFIKIWDTKRLEINLNTKLAKVFEEAETKDAKDIKLRFIRAYLNYAEQYGVETFQLCTGRTIAVDPYHPEGRGIYECKGDTQEVDRPLVEIEDLMNITLTPTPRNTTQIQIQRESAGPLMLEMSERSKVMSFVALLDGYYRLRVDYHFYLCADIYSEQLKKLKSFGCHGPVSRDWAAQRLMEKHKQLPQLNYILKLKSDVMYNYVLMYLPKDGTDKVVKVVIEKVEASGQYRLRQADAPVFDSVEELLKYYKRPDSHPSIQLQHCVRPAQPVDPLLYLCLQSPPAAAQPAAAAAGSGDHGVGGHFMGEHATATLVSGVNITDSCLGRGWYTEVYEGEWDRQRGDVQKAAIKQLRVDTAPPHALQGLLCGLHQAAFWHRQELLSVHALCLAPRVQAVLELAPLGELTHYFQQPNNNITHKHLISAAQQLAQALLYLQVELNVREGFSNVHGNIRCRNVLVFYHSKEELGVKLGDPGLVHYFKYLPIQEAPNAERVAWLAPELLQSQRPTQLTIYTDRYSYGMCLWELFSGGKRPLGGKTVKQVMGHVLGSRNMPDLPELPNLPKPEQCMPEMYEIIKGCCKRAFDERTDPKDVIRMIRSIYLPEDGLYYTLTEKWQEEEREHMAVVNRDNLLNGQIAAAAAAAAATVSAATVSTAQGSTPHPHITPTINPNNIVPWSDDVTSQDPLLEATSVDSTLLGSATTQCTDIVTSGGAAAAAAMPDPPPVRIPMSQRSLPELPHVQHSEPCAENNFLLPFSAVYVDNVKNNLGEGCYGTVKKGTYRARPGAPILEVAIKFIKDTKNNDLEPEMTIMGGLSHPNIVKLIGHCRDELGDNSMMLVMEYVERGCLRDFVKDRSTRAEFKRPDKLLTYALDIAEGMLYLSEKKILHRDLAARNVLVTKDIRMKIADFGLSHMLRDEEKDYYRSGASKQIPAYWCAPESLTDRLFYSVSDVWSFGVTMWEMFSCESPTKWCNTAELVTKLHRGDRLKKPDNCSEEAYKLMIKCWCYDHTKRIDFKGVCTKLLAAKEGGGGRAATTR